MVKLLAFHLPQYHTFPENDEWWGKGFTDWVNIKKAKPLYKGHNQPKVPIDGYYDMLDKKTHVRQAELAKQYGIYGFCYYHYWFNGKMLMEKPLEMILDEKDIELPFCMCWANEPWTRSWDGKSKEVIMPQSYGNKKDWEKHIQYLLPFFKDERYIKIDNKPVFVIYRTNYINDCDAIIAYWESICKENGFDGIYLVEELNGFQFKPTCKKTSAVLEFEPIYTHIKSKTVWKKAVIKLKERLGIPYSKYSYAKTCKKIINRPIAKYDNKKTFLGMFAGWDNTPRRKKGGEIAEDATAEKFYYALKKQVERSNSINSDFLFINAWNEWAEGAYLEADDRNGYSYLEAVKRVVENC